jgi:ZIP family zinc transporter
MEAASTWFGALRTHARAHRLTLAGFGGAILATATLLAAGLSRIAEGDAGGEGLRHALLGGTVGFAATALGALPGLYLRAIAQRLEDTMLGFAAGMMLSASAFSLLLPGLAAARDIVGHELPGSAVVVAGMALGVMLMLGLDRFTPHLHQEGGPCGAGHERCARAWLFVFAIALHNLPEGMAIGVGFAGGDMAVGLPLVAAIAIQDLPEGLVVALALRGAGLTAPVAVLVAGASRLMEPLGALIGSGLSSGLAITYPIGLGMAAGAMIFVVSHEVIPETHRNGHQTPATIGLLAGFAAMMVLDTALG